MLDISFLDIIILDILLNRTKTDLKIQKPKTLVSIVEFFSAAWGRFFTLSHSRLIFKSQSIFFRVISICTSSSESLRLTISWTNSVNSQLESTQ